MPSPDNVFLIIGFLEWESNIFRFYDWIWGRGVLVSDLPWRRGFPGQPWMRMGQGQEGRRMSEKNFASEAAAWVFILRYFFLSPNGRSRHWGDVPDQGLKA